MSDDIKIILAKSIITNTMALRHADIDIPLIVAQQCTPNEKAELLAKSYINLASRIVEVWSK